jgi:predicted RNase H-like nuclease (RuvC/YqgF family)
MDDYTLIKASVLLNHTFAKIRSSVDEIKEKHPHRKDLIDSMEQSLIDLNNVRNAYHTLEKEYRAAMQTCFRLERINLELKVENKELKTEIESLTTEL